MSGRDPIASRTIHAKSGVPKGMLDTRNNDGPAKTSAVVTLSHYRGGEGPWGKFRSISLATHVFLNCNCVILDVVAVNIGAGTHIGPAVQIYTADHPRDSAVRRSRAEFGRPIAIGRNVRIGGATFGMWNTTNLPVPNDGLRRLNHQHQSGHSYLAESGHFYLASTRAFAM
jgi:hypothetical protein